MNGFTFFRNYYEAINDPENDLSEEEQGKLYNAIFAYMFDGKEPALKGACKMAFSLIKPSLDISRVRSEARKKSVEKEDGGEEDGGDGNQTAIKTNQTAIKPQSNGNQTAIKGGFDRDLTFLEERSKKIEEESTKSDKDRKKEIEKKTSSAGARTGQESHEDVMDDLGVASPAYREKLREFLTACYVNGHVVTNAKLGDIISRLDVCYGEDDGEKIRSLQRAISGGFFDVEELRLADPQDRILWRRS